MQRRVILLVLLSVLHVGCTDSKNSRGSESIKWPEKSDIGSPVVAESLGLEGKPMLRLFNFADASAVNVVLYLRFLDESGKELRGTPINYASKSGVVKGKKHSDKRILSKIPAGTARVSAEVRRVEFDGAEEWLHPGGLMPAITK